MAGLAFLHCWVLMSWPLLLWVLSAIFCVITEASNARISASHESKPVIKVSEISQMQGNSFQDNYKPLVHPWRISHNLTEMSRRSLKPWTLNISMPFLLIRLSWWQLKHLLGLRLHTAAIKIHSQMAAATRRYPPILSEHMLYIVENAQERSESKDWLWEKGEKWQAMF